MPVETIRMNEYESKSPETTPPRAPYTADAGLVEAQIAVGGHVTSLFVSYHAGKYLDKACLDFYPNSISLKELPAVLKALALALVGSDWVYERIEWAWRTEIAVDAIWLLRNAHE